MNEVVVGFVGMVVDCFGGRMADLSCCFGDYRSVGAVADSSIVIAVDLDKMGD